MNFWHIDRPQAVGSGLSQLFAPLGKGLARTETDAQLHLLSACRAVDKIVRQEMIVMVVGDEDIFQPAGVYMMLQHTVTGIAGQVDAQIIVDQRHGPASQFPALSSSGILADLTAAEKLRNTCAAAGSQISQFHMRSPGCGQP